MKKLNSVILALAIMAPALMRAATVPSPDKLLPADTLVVFTIPDYTKASAVVNSTAGGQLWADPVMKPFKEKFINKFKSDLVEPLEKQFGIKFSDYTDLVKGQVTIALTQNNWAGKSGEPGFLVLVDTRDKSDALKTNLAALKKKWVESDKQLRVEKIRDLEFTTFIYSSDELSKAIEKALPDANAGFESLDAPKAKKAPHKEEIIIGQSGSLFIMGHSVKDIEKILVRQADGAVPSLSEQGAFAASYNSMFRDSLGYAWVNLKGFIDIVTKAMGQDANAGGPMAGMGEKALSALGLTSLQSLALNMQNSGDGTTVTMKLSIPESSRKGLFKILAADPKDSAPPAFVPADAVKFSRVRLDLQKTIAGLESMVNEISPSYGSILKTVIDMAGKDKDPNFDLRKNLLANLGDDIVSWQKVPRKNTLEDLGSPPVIFLISSPKPEQLASALKALTSLVPNPTGGAAKVKEREFLGRKVYSMPLPAQRPGAKASDRSLHYAASGSYVALSADVAMLEEYLRGGDVKPLRDTPGLAEAAQKIGGMGTGMFGFENQQETMRVTLEILKKESGTLANLMGNSQLAGRLGISDDGKKFKDWLDFSLLPAFSQIAKYFSFDVWEGNFDSEGINFKFYAPTPPQVRK
ncbi:MAG TPA: hypothetical protein VGE41_09350 [Verrucomicrobiae bacterium]